MIGQPPRSVTEHQEPACVSKLHGKTVKSSQTGDIVPEAPHIIPMSPVWQKICQASWSDPPHWKDPAGCVLRCMAQDEHRHPCHPCVGRAFAPVDCCRLVDSCLSSAHRQSAAVQPTALCCCSEPVLTLMIYWLLLHVPEGKQDFGWPGRACPFLCGLPACGGSQCAAMPAGMSVRPADMLIS